MNDQETAKQPEHSSSLKSAGQLAFHGASIILSLLQPPVAMVGAAGAVALSAWQAEQLKKFTTKVEQALETLDQTKLDWQVFESEQFKELVVRIWEEASKTASDRKQEAFASALVNTGLLSNSSLSEKISLFRVLAEMSDEALLVFMTVQETQRHPGLGCSEGEIAAVLKWNLRKVCEVCEELARLYWFLEITDSGNWMITSRGTKLIEWVTGVLQPERLEKLKKNFKKDARQEAINVMADVFQMAATRQRFNR